MQYALQRLAIVCLSALSLSTCGSGAIPPAGGDDAGSRMEGTGGSGGSPGEADARDGGPGGTGEVPPGKDGGGMADRPAIEAAREAPADRPSSADVPLPGECLTNADCPATQFCVRI